MSEMQVNMDYIMGPLRRQIYVYEINRHKKNLPYPVKRNHVELLENAILEAADMVRQRRNGLDGEQNEDSSG